MQPVQQILFGLVLFIIMGAHAGMKATMREILLQLSLGDQVRDYECTVNIITIIIDK